MVNKGISDFIKEKLKEKRTEDKIIYFLGEMGVNQDEAKQAIKEVKSSILSETQVPLPKEKPVVPGFFDTPQKKPETIILIIAFFILIVIIGVVIFFYSKKTPPTEDTTATTETSTVWLKGYNYRKAITVKSEENLSDYQVSFNVSYDSNMQNDFDDIRFVSSDGTTKLDYWLELKTDSNEATFWVKVPSLVIGNNIIYMYYGNASASSESSGNDTFTFFDHFEGNSLDMQKWDRNFKGTTSISVSNGYVRLYSVLGNLNQQDIISKATFSRDSILEMKYRLETSRYRAYLSAATSYDHSLPQFPSGHYVFLSMGDGYKEGLSLKTEFGNSRLASGDDLSDVWTRAKLINGSNIQKAYINDNLKSSRSDSMGDYNYKAFISEVSPYNSDFYIDVDWIFVRQYTAIEPSVSFGKEQPLDASFILKEESTHNFIKVLSPNGGEDLCIGEDTFIEWESRGIEPTAIVSLNTFNQGNPTIEIYPITDNETGEEGVGRVPWKAGNYSYGNYFYSEGSKMFKITITGTDKDGNSYTDSSDDYFSLTNCKEGY